MRCPAVPLAVAFTFGVVLPAGTSPLVASSLGAVALLSSLWCLRRNRLHGASFAVLLAFLAIGKTARDVRSDDDIGLTVRALFERLGARAFVDPSRVTGTLRVEPEVGSEDTTLTLEVNGIRMGGARGEISVGGVIRARVYGSFNEKLTTLAAGDGVVLWARLRRPRAFGNPAAFDVESYLERENVDAVASVKSALLVELEPRRPTVSSAMSFLRVLARQRLERALNEPTLGVVLALTTGDRSRLPPGLERLYQKSGIYHVMAISGAHVAIIAWALHALMRRLLIDEAPRLAVLLLTLPLYAAFCSGRPPVVRAVVMACVVIGARLSSLDRPGSNALAVGATALLAFEPRWIGDPGFQLSFAAMAGILLLTEPLSRRLPRLGFCATPLALSISAQLGVVPIAAWHFQRLTPLAPVASLFALPLAGCLVVLGLVSVLVSGIPIVGDVLRESANFLVFLLTKTAEAASWLPPSTWVVSRPSLIGSIVYVGATVALTARSRFWTRIGLAAVAAFLCALTVSSPAPRGRLVLSAFDVGHGDALLVTLPDGKRILVDGGGVGVGGGSSFDIGERVLLPCLIENGVRRLAAVVVTHTHLDHLGGLFAVFDNLKVDEMWESSSPVGRPAYFALRRRAERRGVVVRSLETRQTFELGGAGFEVLASGMPGSSENDQSLVLSLTYAGRRILLTGDVESPAEHRLLASGASLESDVLKVAHHGSRSSSSVAFLAAVAPRLAILSARASPGRPLPSARILHRLRALGIDYLRTDENGAITVSVDGDGELEVSTYRGESS